MPYLSIDIGSSAVKAGVISERGELLGIARRASPLLNTADEAHEADALLWIDAAASACRELLSRGDRVEIRALCVSGNGPTLVPVDGQGQPLGLALTWMDRRASSEAAEVSVLAGRIVDPSFYLPKALRLWRSSEELRKRLRWFFSCPEYLVFALSGRPVTYLPHPGYEPYVWSEALIEGLGLPRDRFPPFIEPGALVGPLLPRSAERFGLPAGTPVVAGYPDFLASIVGTATVRSGLVCDRGGTSEAVNLCADRAFPGRELLSLPHAVAGLWNVSGGLSTAGKALEWFAGAGGYGARPPARRQGQTATTAAPQGSDADAPSELLAEARRSPAGAKGLFFLPYLAGERAPLWDSERRGAFLGLSLMHERGDLARAVCESIGFGLRLPLELARAAGFPVELVRASGASARNAFLNALKADILNLPLETTEVADGELVGDACASALALGEATDIAEAALALVRVERRFEPDAALADRYELAFAEYRAAVAALGPVDAGLARLRAQQQAERRSATEPS